MPIYATRCKNCANETDLLLRLNEELPKCEKCSTGELEKIPAASNFSFRGGSPTPRFYR